MRASRFLSVFALMVVVSACNGEASDACKIQTTLAKPAPAGTTPLNVETIAEGLVSPWSLAFLPDGSVLFTERNGKLRVIRDGALDPQPVAGTPDAYVASQGGYFDILLDPNFASNRRLYLSFAAGAPKSNATRIISATFDTNALTDIKTVFETATKKATAVHYGGRMALLPDNTLLVTLGDGFDYREQAQDLNSGLGKIVRINLDGSIPADNPFTNQKDALPEIWSYGHRNEQGLAVDAANGVVYETEHGARGGDEINVIEKGANYGWPIATYGIDYSGAQITPFVKVDGTRQPIKYWTPSIAPSGLAVYRGGMFSSWNGDLLVGGLSDKGAELRGLHHIIMKDGAAAGEERYLVGERVRDVRAAPDGSIWVTTEDHGGAPVGKILRLTPAAS